MRGKEKLNKLSESNYRTGATAKGTTTAAKGAPPPRPVEEYKPSEPPKTLNFIHAALKEALSREPRLEHSISFLREEALIWSPLFPLSIRTARTLKQTRRRKKGGQPRKVRPIVLRAKEERAQEKGKGRA